MQHPVIQSRNESQVDYHPVLPSEELKEIFIRRKEHQHHHNPHPGVLTHPVLITMYPKGGREDRQPETGFEYSFPGVSVI